VHPAANVTFYFSPSRAIVLDFRIVNFLFIFHPHTYTHAHTNAKSPFVSFLFLVCFARFFFPLFVFVFVRRQSNRPTAIFTVLLPCVGRFLYFTCIYLRLISWLQWLNIHNCSGTSGWSVYLPSSPVVPSLTPLLFLCFSASFRGWGVINSIVHAQFEGPNRAYSYFHIFSRQFYNNFHQLKIKCTRTEQRTHARQANFRRVIDNGGDGRWLLGGVRD